MSGATLLGTHVPCAQGEGEGAHDPVCSLALWFATAIPSCKEGSGGLGRILGRQSGGPFSPRSQSLLMSFQTWSEPRVQGYEVPKYHFMLHNSGHCPLSVILLESCL